MRFNADFYRIAFACASTEETRFYLRGVFVEPSESGGAILTATDGHRMICIHDEKAEFGAHESPLIIRLSPEALKLCKAKRGEERREIAIAGDVATIEIVTIGENGDHRQAIGLSPNCIVDGTFPDWRRVIPATIAKGNGDALDAYQGKYIAGFADIGDELAKVANHARGGVMQMRVNEDGPNRMAWIHWAAIPHAFGVLMPMRADTVPAADKPTWTSARRVRTLHAVA